MGTPLARVLDIEVAVVVGDGARRPSE